MPTLPPRPTRRALSFAAAGLLAAALVGCGGGDAATLPVEGKVLVDGQPLTKGAIRFQPDTAKGNKLPYEPAGEIGAEGVYKVTSRGKAGAPAGWYKVSVTSTDLPDSSKPFAAKSYVAAKFGDPEKSGLSVEVTATPAAGAYDLKVTAK